MFTSTLIPLAFAGMPGGWEWIIILIVALLIFGRRLPEIARKIEADLRPHFPVIYDQQSSIGKRYYRQDEAGTPYGITVDHQTIDDNTVTLRERDTQEQVRLPIPALAKEIKKRMRGV